jgi:S-(hydroxymethyl)glutathione dehydrogenase / alcohol dehydrogenase
VKAALLVSFGEPLAIEDVEPVPVGPHDVRVRIDASGVCHTDLSVASGALPRALPIIPGHEASGTVTEVGRDVTRVRVGDRVIGAIITACGNCWFCLHDRSNLCTHLFELQGSPKATRADGSVVPGASGLATFAEEMTVDETLVVPVATDLPAEQLALVGCGVATGVGAVLNTAHVEPGATVAVFGCGGVGQSVVQGARIAGAARIFAIDPVPLKRDTAAALGATDLVDPGAADPVEQVIEATGGLGVDYAFEVTGLPAVLLQTYRSVRRGGTAVMIGMPRHDDRIEFPAFELFVGEKQLASSVYGTTQVRRDFPRLVTMAESGHLDLASLVSRRFSLDQINDAIAAMERGEVIRAVLV